VTSGRVLRDDPHVTLALAIFVAMAILAIPRNGRWFVRWQTHASVSLEERDGALQLAVRDDGAGGADLGRGSGLVGLRDRMEALGGTIEVASPQGSGTTVQVTLPTGTR
jgi:signal transduction histidine kinase